MIVIGSALFGAVFGGLRAKKRGGGAADIAQYGAVYSILFTLAGLLATIILYRVTN